MAQLILKKTNYTLQNGITLSEVYATPIGLYVEQTHIMAVRHVWGIYATKEKLLARRENPHSMLETKEYSWSGDAADLATIYPSLYAPIAGAMLQVAQATLDTTVEGQEEKVSWFDGAEQVDA